MLRATDRMVRRAAYCHWSTTCTVLERSVHVHRQRPNQTEASVSSYHRGEVVDCNPTQLAAECIHGHGQAKGGLCDCVLLRRRSKCALRAQIGRGCCPRHARGGHRAPGCGAVFVSMCSASGHRAPGCGAVLVSMCTQYRLDDEPQTQHNTIDSLDHTSSVRHRPTLVSKAACLHWCISSVYKKILTDRSCRKRVGPGALHLRDRTRNTVASIKFAI